MGISLPNGGFNSLLHTFMPQKKNNEKTAARLKSFNSPKPVNKTRSMAPSESESPPLSIPQPHFFPPSHALLLQLPLCSCPCSSFFIIYLFPHLHSHTPTEPHHFSTLSPWLTGGLSIYLLVMWLRLRFLGAADNSGILPFTFSHAPSSKQPNHGHHSWSAASLSHPPPKPRETEQVLINAASAWLPLSVTGCNVEAIFVCIPVTGMS